MSQTPITKTAVVNNPNGLHMRPAGMLSKMAAGYQAEVTLTKDGLTVDASSVLDLITLVATQGSEIVVSGTGEQAQAAVDAVAEFIATDDTEDIEA